MNYTEKVIYLTKNKGITPYKLANNIEGVSVNTATNWFKNKKVPEKHALKIADYFEIEVRSLLDDEISIVEEDTKEV